MEEELFGSSDDDDSDKRSARSDRSDADVNNGQSVRQSDDDEEAVEGARASRSPSPSASGSASAASASPAPSDVDAEPEAADDDVQHSDDQEEGQGQEKQQQSDDERSEDEAPRDDEEASEGERSARSEEPDDVGSQSGDDRNEHSGSGAELEETNADGSEPEAEAAADDDHAAQSGSESEAEVEAEGSPQQEADDGSARESGSDNEASGKRKRSDQEAEDESQSPRRESGSESDTSSKKKRRVGSDNDDDDKNAIAADLFGEADDISSDSGGEGKAKPDIDPLANLSPEPENDMDDEPEGENSPAPVPEEEEAEAAPVPEEIPETRIDVEIPKITTDLGKDLHFVKLPNFLSVETRPFDQQTYEDEIDEDEVLDEEGRARLKLKVENTIRWRWGFDKEGNPVRESNARIVKWTDGSMSLHLGSEIFDVHKQLLQGDHNHMFIRQGTGLQGQAVFRTKLTFRPHSTDSFTHRKITMSVADRSQKTQKIRILPNVGQDPEAHRSEMIKKEEDRLKASIRRENKQRRIRDRALSRGLTSAYLEQDRYDDDEEDDDGAISLAAIKNKYKKGIREVRPSIYSSESDASDIDDRGARRLERAKALADSDDERGAKDSDEQPSGSEGPKKRIARIEDSDED